MELVNRYLHEVKQGLPAGQQDDIIKELSANIMAELEDREAALGRPLSDAEQAAILQRHGAPLAVAGRYVMEPRTLAFGRQLIGPVLFPLYARVLAITMGLTLLVCVAVTLALYVSDGPISLLDAAQASLIRLGLQFGIVTLVFIVAERNAARSPDSWMPQALRSAPKAPFRVSRLESLAQLGALVVFLLWLLAVRDSPDPDGLRLGPVWGQLFLPLVLLTLVGMAQAGANLVRPDWVRLYRAMRVLNSGVWLLLMIFLLQAGEWVVVADPGGAEARLRELVAQANYYFFYGLLAFTIISALIAIYDVWLLLRDSHPRRQSQARA